MILPTYNRANVVGRAIRSVLAQTFTDLELLVIDNGSTDETASVVAQFDDSRLIYFRENQRIGAATARNIGVEKSRAPLVAFQDSDDEWLLNKLALQVEKMESASARPDMVTCEYLIAQRDGGVGYFKAKPYMIDGNWTAEQIYDFGFITPTWLVKRHILEEVGGFDVSLPNLEDWELVFRIFARHRIVVVDEPLLMKYGSEDSINVDRPSRIDSLQAILRMHGELWRHSPGVMARLYRELGTLQCAVGDVRNGRQHLFQSLRYERSHLKTWFKYFAAWGGNSAYQLASRLVN